MAKGSSGLARTIAVVRILTAVFFLFFGQYKVFRPGFAHGGFQQYLEGFIQTGSIDLKRPGAGTISRKRSAYILLTAVRSLPFPRIP